MGKGKKSSRKGKKAWRANISTKDFDDYIDKAARDERSGGSLNAVPNERLFFVDKSSDTSRAKKTTKHKDKMLFSDCILERTSLIPPLPSITKRKGKSNMAKSVKAKLHHHQAMTTREKSAAHCFNIWGNEDKSSNDCSNHTQKKVQTKRIRSSHNLTPAVEVDAPGCSYNPSFQDHQEALGLAVAQEMQKVYQKELEPPPIPRTVPGTVIDEEDHYFLEVGDDVDEPDYDETQEDIYKWSRPIKVKKHTRAELNKKKRMKEQSKLEECSRKQAKVEEDVLRLSEIIKEIENEEDDKQRERLRRTISKQEKLAQGPPRLGKYKFKPEPIQVLLSEEISGSMRKVKGCCTLARERYSSLQKRGLLEPRLPAKRRPKKKRIYFEQGTKGQKEREMHAAMEAYQAAARQGYEKKKSPCEEF